MHLQIFFKHKANQQALVTDAIIIGSGHNSLVCAAHLATKGWSVAVYEQAAVPGGAIKTAELTLPGFRHDWAAMNLSLFAGSQFSKTYGDVLSSHGLDYVPAQNPFASVFPDGKWFGVSADPVATAERVDDFSPADARAWKEMSASFFSDAEPIFDLLGSPVNKRSIAKLALKTLPKLGINRTLDLARFMMMSPRGWLDETFESNHVKATLAAWGMHLDFAPDIAGGALFPYLEAMAGQAFGMVLGKGGANTVTNALKAMIDANGGTIECGANVTRVLHENGRARGIVLDDGRQVMAKKAVIANVAPRALARLTGETGNKVYDKGLSKFRHAPGTMMIHLAMEDLPDWTAGPELRDFAYVHIAPSMDYMARTYQEAQAGLLPKEPVIVCGQPTTVDPSRAPEGKHVLWLQVRMAPGEIRGDAAGEIAAMNWQDAAEPFAERALDILETYAPGTRAKIIGKHIVSPMDLEADNPNLVGGDQVCGSHHLNQHFLFRPFRGHADGNTPIANLHHTGAAVWPGAGTGAGPGFLLAQKLAGK
ncbi:NAD(P)/FAD-dependent oxidoreductase [Labrenzia sp. PHM005]|nr:NAD(P)/FAD-dependent oxidoreductase [Labrenzia sp. PHM005]QDG77364.1 NAD(P)/FAD-dependent oxidoreductase [Labrenzia sp. PHM005]